nr:MAG TPA_asm: hypothetical protein [Bacteriophage sp.]
MYRRRSCWNFIYIRSTSIYILITISIHTFFSPFRPYNWL